MKTLLSLGAFCLLALPLMASPVGSIRQVLALSPDEASERRPVNVMATLLLDDRFRSTFFIYDGTASCYALIPAKVHQETLQRGQRYQVQGVTQAGGYRPIIEVASLTPLGPGREPEPRWLKGDAMFLTEADAQWVAIEGRVEGSSVREGGPCLGLSVEGWKVEAFLPREVFQESSLPWHLIGQRVRITGIAAGVFNDERQMTRRFFYVPSLQHVMPLDPAVKAPATAVQATSLLRVGSELKQLLRVRGLVTHSVPGEAVYLRDSSGTLRILSAQPTSFRPGDEVEAEGFPALEPLRPALNATVLRKIRQGPAPDPVAIEADGKFTTRLHHELVIGNARLLAIGEGPEAFSLQCQAGQEIFQAVLDRRLAPALPTALSPGCELALTGLLELRPSQFFICLIGLTDFVCSCAVPLT